MAGLRIVSAFKFLALLLSFGRHHQVAACSPHYGNGQCFANITCSTESQINADCNCTFCFGSISGLGWLQFPNATFNFSCLTLADIGGDPHFKTWGGEHYEYHGKCDLVMLHEPAFASSLGLDIHIRTEIPGGFTWSYISVIAIRIGSDIVEVDHEGGVYLNNVAVEDNSTDIGSAGFTLTKSDPEDINTIEEEYNVFQGTDRIIHIKRYQDFLWLNIAGDDFYGSVGLLGSTYSDAEPRKNSDSELEPEESVFGSVGSIVGSWISQIGGLLGGAPEDTGLHTLVTRNGQEVDLEVADVHEFISQEWQVRDTDPQLFRSYPAPQYPEKCVLASANVVSVTSDVSRAAAEEACAHFGNKASREACIFDVMQVGDLDLAEAGLY